MARSLPVVLLSVMAVSACGAALRTDTPAPLGTDTLLAPTPVPLETEPVPAILPSSTSSDTPAETPLPTATSTPVVGAIRNRPGIYYDRLVLRNYPYWFKVHVPPSYRPGAPSALVFNLHGLGSNLEQQELLSGMSAKADEAGFVVVYPQAGASVWNVRADEIGALHVELFRQLIETLEVRLSIDPARIYATGFSNGGGMVHRLACDLSDRIAAIAPVAGAHLPGQECQPNRPVAVLAVHGTADRLGPYLNEELGHNIPQWVADWAVRNGCDPKPVVSQEGKVRVESWENCAASVSVLLYSVEEMGHAWPGSPQGDLFGQGSQDLVANDLIWAFFEAQARPLDGRSGQP